MPHLVLLGDSIFDNEIYVPGEPSVTKQVQANLPADWRVTLLAVDGAITTEVLDQLRDLPADTTHLALSTGGNDALETIPKLDQSATSVYNALSYLNQWQTEFRQDYRKVITALKSTGLPLVACTVYDQVPSLTGELRTALSLFNDVIVFESARQKIPTIDLRLVCTGPDDFSAESDIEPSAQGGEKIARLLSSWAMKQAGVSV